MRLRHFVIALPLLLCTAYSTGPLSQVRAANNDATEAAALLAKSRAIDEKCSVLAKDKSQDLRDFVARAEISLAEKASVALARKTMSGGRAEGKTAVCDAAATTLVNNVLAAANTAVAALIQNVTSTAAPDVVAVAPVPVALPDKAVAPDKPRKPKTKVATVKLGQSARNEKPDNAVKPVNGLGTYAVVAEKYFVASRCGTMRSSDITRLYKSVLSNHQQALVNNRPVAVRAMLRAAEARAGAKSCG